MGGRGDGSGEGIPGSPDGEKKKKKKKKRVLIAHMGISHISAYLHRQGRGDAEDKKGRDGVVSCG